MPSRRSRHFQTVPPMDGIPLRKFLTAAGDGTGAYNLNGNYSATALTAYYEAVQRFEMYSLLINVSCAAKLNQTDYGDITTGVVTNGIRFYIKPDGVDIPLLTDFGITKNYQWAALTPDINITSFDGTAQTLIVNIDMIHQYGRTLTLLPGQQLKAVLNDNFSGLVNHSIGIRGTQFET